MVLALLAIARLERRPLHLVWRTRWLLLVLVLGYGFGVPGDAAFSFLGDWAPTWPGLAIGAGRAFHLMTLLLWLDVLVLSLSSQQMLSGLHVLMQPLAALGVDSGRIALRLALTLKAIERLEQGGGQAPVHVPLRGRGNLRRLFDPVTSDLVPEHVVLTHYPIRSYDVWIPVLLIAVFGVLLWVGGWN